MSFRDTNNGRLSDRRFSKRVITEDSYGNTLHNLLRCQKYRMIHIFMLLADALVINRPLSKDDFSGESTVPSPSPPQNGYKTTRFRYNRADWYYQRFGDLLSPPSKQASRLSQSLSPPGLGRSQKTQKNEKRGSSVPRLPDINQRKPLAPEAWKQRLKVL